MLSEVFAVYDGTVRVFLDPFLCRRIAEGVRMFATAARTPDHPFHQNPHDFTLFYLGTFDPATGAFDLLEAPESHGAAARFLSDNDPSTLEIVSDD